MTEAAQDALHYCNSFNRLPTLIAIWLGSCGDISAEEWLRLLGEEWTCCDNIAQYVGYDEEVSLWDTPLAEVLSGDLDGSPMMTPEERLAFAALPDEVEVWRGCYEHNKWGLSWSLDRDTAAKFPAQHRYRHEGQPILVRAVAKKRDIAALKLDRGEAEVITHRPRHVSTSHIRPSVTDAA
jgi:hypothetical protein